MLRSVILAASRSHRVERLVETAPLTRDVVRPLPHAERRVVVDPGDLARHRVDEDVGAVPVALSGDGVEELQVGQSLLDLWVPRTVSLPLISACAASQPPSQPRSHGSQATQQDRSTWPLDWRT